MIVSSSHPPSLNIPFNSSQPQSHVSPSCVVESHSSGSAVPQSTAHNSASSPSLAQSLINVTAVSTATATENSGTVHSDDQPQTPATESQNSPPHLVRSVNVHPMITRAKDGIVQPRIHPSLLLVHAEPKSVKQALQDSKWHSAITDEFHALQRNKTWTLVPLPSNRNAIGCKWVFRVKENSDGSGNRYKARLVVKGFKSEVCF